MQFTIRPATPANASYRGIVPDEEFEKRPLSRRQAQWKQWFEHDYVTLVACNDQGDVVGFGGAQVLRGGEAPFDSYLNVLYLRPETQGHGVGKTLLQAIAGELLRAGARSMALRTLRLNPARKFYEKLGARFIPEGMEYQSGVFDDVVYAFDDLSRLHDGPAASALFT